MKNFLKKWIAAIISMTMLAGQSSFVFAEDSTVSSTQVELEQTETDKDSVDDTVAEETQKQIEIPAEQAKIVETVDEQEENPVENLEQESSGYYLTLDGLTWVYQSDYIDVGTAYSTNDPYVQFKWEMYNVNTGQWFTIADWNYGNWASWKTDCGDYWLHCTARTSDGAIERSSTIAFHYVAGNTQISSTYLGGDESGDGTLLLGCASMSEANGVTYSFKLYDVTNCKWISILERGGKWATYAPQNGVYWAHYELYTADGRIADTRTYAFEAKRPIRRALAIGTPNSLIWAGNNLNSIGNMYTNTSFLGEKGIIPYVYRNQNINQITNLFQKTFESTTDNDVSYVYITCHSSSDNKIYLANDGQYITTAQLRELCDSWIKGSVVIMLDTCYSGQAISASDRELDEEFVDNFIKEFDDSAVPASGELAENRYYVLCSSASWEQSWGWRNGNGFATKYWEYGAGWNPTTNTKTTMQADSNGDSRITLNEMYLYSSVKVTEEAKSMFYPMSQTVKVYPQNSNFVIFGRY